LRKTSLLTGLSGPKINPARKRRGLPVMATAAAAVVVISQRQEQKLEEVRPRRPNQMTNLKNSAPPAKHIPQRTCIACRKTGVKRELVRLVCTPEGEVEIDLTGKKEGRGAYLCPVTSCWESAINSGKLEFAFRSKIKPENKEKLVNYAKGINNTNSGIKRS
jgi:uncharacterized protein